MKKKLLILALPALMVMSSCTSLESATAQNNFDFFKEDTAIHEEFFNKSQPMNLGEPEETPEAGSGFTSVPKIGVQYSGVYEVDVKDGEGNPTGEKKNCFAVRYVAAIEGLESGAVTAEWTRGVSDKTSNPVKPVAGGHYSTVEYTTLNDGNDPKDASSEGGKYAKYVVYTMYDIPEAQADSFIVAYLTLSKIGETPVRSKAVAARVAGDHAFSFAPNKSAGYFMAGTIHGAPNTIVDFEAGSGKEGEDKAKKLDQELNGNDLFGYYLINNTNGGYLSSFQYYGWTTFKDQQFYLERDSGSELFKVRIHGTYDLYINKDFHLWMDCDSADTVTLYFKPNNNWKATNKYGVWYTDNGGSWSGGFLPLVDGETDVYKLEGYNFVSHPSIIFVRHNPSYDSPAWDGGKYDETATINFINADGSRSPLESMFTMQPDTWSGSGGTWSKYTPSNS